MSKNKKNYGPNSRGEMERDEKQSVVKTDMPDSRFSSKMQTSVGAENVTDAQPAGSADGDIVVKAATAIKDKVKVHPASEAELLENETVGGVSLDSTGSPVRNAAGASTASVVGDQSKIPYTKGGFRPDGRFDRKIADNDFLINNAICEQIAPVFEGTKPIQESGGKKQGYFGRKQFTQARGKKNAGIKPQSTMFDRSVDFVEVDATIHTTGQVLDSAFEIATPPVTGAVARVKSQYPDIRATADGDFDANSGYEDGPNMLKTNYVLKSMSVTFERGRLKAIRFNEDRVDAHAESLAQDQANLNWQIDRNVVTNSVVRLQKELGRETTDKWSPLGYVITEPYEYNTLAHDIEASLGAIMGAAYRANTSALSFNFNNKIKKDGADPTTPAVDMFLNGIGNTANSNVAKQMMSKAGGFRNAIFNKSLYNMGSAAAIIAMFDTTSKYKTKASFANYQKSLKFFVQAMDNNINPLHAKPEFLAALDTAHVYSSIDGNYNPMLPIFATRKISLVNPMSLDYFCDQFDRTKVGGSAGFDEYGLPIKYAYKYNDLRNVYYQNMGHPLVAGIVRWILNHEEAWADTFGDGTATMSCALDMLYPTLFGMILAAASQDILYTRVQYFKDFLFAGDQSEYIWPDLKGLDTLNFKASSNMTLSSYSDPIVMGKMKTASAIRLLWPETYSALNYNSTAFDECDMVMPWFFSEQSTNASYDMLSGFLNPDRPCVMSYPECRHGVTHDYIDMLHGVEERDLRLILDRPVALPLPVASTSEVQSNGGARYTFYDTDKGTLDRRYLPTDISDDMKLAALRYDTNSDGRIVVHFNKAKTKGKYLTKASLLCAPRELGYLYPYARNASIITDVAYSNDVFTLTTVGNVGVGGRIDGSMGYDLVSYSALGSGLAAPNTIDRQVALQQKYIKCYADRSAEVVALNDAYVTETGLVPAFTGLLNADGSINATRAFTSKKQCLYNVGQTSMSSVVDTTGLYTFSAYDWTALNRVFLPVNPFENCFVSGSDSSNPGVLIDPMEGCFKYGIAGFFGSDFTEDVYDRSEKFIQLGQFYTEDDFLTSSLALRV